MYLLIFLTYAIRLELTWQWLTIQATLLDFLAKIDEYIFGSKIVLGIISP
jgi:hypothetical protein